MISELTNFDFESHIVRVVPGPDGEPWWIAGDVCRVLDIANVGNALARLDDDEKGSIHTADGTPGSPNRAIISESGLYSLILTSRKPEAKRFKKWVTSEVLPSIRKTGRYAVEPVLTSGDALIHNAEMLLEALKRQRECERRLALAEADASRAMCLADRAIGLAGEARGDAEAANAKATVALDTLLHNDGYMTLLGYSAMHKLGYSTAELAKHGKRLTAYCIEEGYPFRKTHDMRFGEVNAYRTVEVLDKDPWFGARNSN